MSDTVLKQPLHPTNCPQCMLKTEKHMPFCSRCNFDLRYGQPSLQKSGQCIYCERVGKLSKEHVFPDWIKKVYPQYHAISHKFTRPERHEYWPKEPIPMHEAAEERQRDAYTRVVFNVCQTCNTGWMSNLQNEAKPLIKSLADGKWPDFTEADILLLSKWAAMVSINLDSLGRMSAIEQYQRTKLMEGAMPPCWRISLGLMSDASCGGESFLRAIQAPINDLRIHSTYFCIERLAIHTISSLGDRILEMNLKYSLPELNLPTRSIWPIYEKITGEEKLLVKDDLLGIQRLFGA